MAISPCSINRSPDWYYHQGTKGMDKYDLWRKIHLDPSSEHISKSISDDYVVPFISTFLASYRCEKRYQGECWRLLAGSLWFIICSYAAQSMLFIITSWVEMKYRVTYIQPYVSKRGKDQAVALGNVNYLTTTMWILQTRTSEFHEFGHIYLEKEVAHP